MTHYVFDVLLLLLVCHLRTSYDHYRDQLNLSTIAAVMIIGDAWSALDYGIVVGTIGAPLQRFGPDSHTQDYFHADVQET